MIQWNKFNTTMTDYDLIAAIVKRAVKLHSSFNAMKLSMDLECAFNDVSLDLSKLLASDTGDFLHDVNGIFCNINRETGKIENCFSPRASRDNFENSTYAQEIEDYTKGLADHPDSI